MVKAEEIEPLAPFGQVHDAGLGRLGLQPQLGQQHRQPRQRGLGLLPACAHHDHVVGEAHQNAVLPTRPCPVQPVQVDVGQQRGGHAPNAMGNFCFEVTLDYRRLELLPRAERKERHDG